MRARAGDDRRGALWRLFDEWRALPAFNTAARDRGRLDAAVLALRTRKGAESTGHAELLPDGGYKILVRVGYDVTDAHATLLHEMAHVVAGWGWRFHTAAWRHVFLAAAEQATGAKIAAPRWHGGSHWDVHGIVRRCLAASRRRA